MPRFDYANCKSCGKHASEVGELSHTRQCASCGERELRTNIVDLATHSGPGFERWRRGMAACVGASLAPQAAEAV